MMQNLFGDQSEEEEEEEVESEHESSRQPGYASDGDEQGESEAERDQSVDQREDSHGRDTDSDEKEEYGQRVVTSRRRDVIDSGSDRSENLFADIDDEEVNQARSRSRSPAEEKDEVPFSNSAPEIRDVFGDSDDEEPTRFGVQNEMGEESNRSPIEEEGNYEKELVPEDMVADEYDQYESEEDHLDKKHKEKPIGPPLELEIPLQHPPALPEKMHLIKVSNIMGIDPRPFDPKTYVEDNAFVKDESGSNKRISLVNNIVRWREVKNPDGTTSIESNARFVHWSDGSIQLMIGNEVLDTTVQDAQHDQAHLFLRHGKGILQSQGRILSKMRFMPSSLSSNSHRLLTALVDSRHKKVYKVKNCVTDIDPEREKEQKERAESQMIRASVSLNRKKEKVSRKYMPTVRRERQLSPGFLEDALEEEEETDYYESRRPAARRRFDEDLEMEAQAERRIMNAKKRDIPRKTSMPAARPSKRPVDFSESEKEESEYETEGEEEKVEHEYEEEGHEQDEEEETYEESEEEAEEPKQKVRESGTSLKRKGIESDEESPPRKAAAHRRMAIVYDSDEE
nr:protein LEO1 homolog isoform X1 [Ipomoea trifida]